MDVARWEPFKKIKRWDPFREMEEMSARLRDLMGKGSMTRINGEEALTSIDWVPEVDIIESEKEYLIKAELPEIKKEDVKVSVEKGVLTIQGERKQEKEEKGKKFHRIERSYGAFERSFTLPDDADQGKVSAEFKDGILSVHLAKSEKAAPKPIEVKAA
ncbi:Hsp20/alpha crystallin family protein [Candidatus Manganitrophus noduliformans]|nr:Hsp20/alpha crystallin family protein [Candidatus Manganitrophus noduliformans]